MAWRYIRMNIDTTDKSLSDKFNVFATQIEPKVSEQANKLNNKLYKVPFLQDLGKDYHVFIKSLKIAIELFREENIKLFSELQVKAQEYGSITASMTIELDGKTLTMQKAAMLLKETDRDLREKVYLKLEERRDQDSEKLQELFDELKTLRHKTAQNTGFKNFRDYKFQAMDRFDYSKEDCFAFHESVSSAITPIVNSFAKERQEKLGLTSLKPWDFAVDPDKKPPLKPFETEDELIEKTIEAFYKIDKDFGDCITLMRDNKHLDLSSKKGKAPGGFNYPLFESGLPFIYMNSVGSNRDLVTMMHEGGHAVHSYLTKDLPISDLKSFPSEVAELASMSMELISMDHWDLFYKDPKTLKRAKKEQLRGTISGLPWIALVDKFQHWIYENPSCSAEDRNEYWLEAVKGFSSNITDWTGLEKYKKQGWLKQLHIFEVPFYYIEYGFAQLGAIAVWKNYKEDPKRAIELYKKALSLGGTRSIPEIYEAAGIKFKFDKAYVQELANFVLLELDKLD